MIELILEITVYMNDTLEKLFLLITMLVKFLLL